MKLFKQWDGSVCFGGTHRLRLRRLAVLLACALGAEPASAGIAQRSLIVKDPGIVEPNIVFTLDDSGSMAYNYLPDNELVDHSFAFHPGEPEGYEYVYYVEGLAATSDTNVLGARRRAPKVNTLYYDPEVQYLPWLDADGKQMENADPRKAYYHLHYGLYGPDRNNADKKRIRELQLDLTGKVPRGKFVICLKERPGWVGQYGEIDCTADTTQTHVMPATYYEFSWPGEKANPPTPPTEADKSNIANYRRVSIMEHESFVRGNERKDCAQGSNPAERICSKEQEFRNFANWFQYHRTRMHVAVGAVGRAFVALPEHVRVGYGRINKLTPSPVDGSDHEVLERGVRSFRGEDRKNFLNWMIGSVANGSTPLVNAMYEVGKYFKRKDDRGPWGNDPSKGKGGRHLSCRRSYHVLMTDGLYNFRDYAGQYASDYTLESDNVDGKEIKGPNDQVYRYRAENPFSSGASGSLADYAMDLWKNDLRDDLINDVPTDPSNPAFWQHVTTHTLSFGVSGNLNPEKDYAALVNGTKSWPNPINPSHVDTIDDLWHAAVNSRGEYVNVIEGVGFFNRIQQILGHITSRIGNTAGVAVSSQSLQADNIKFEPTFVPRDFVGNLEAFRLDERGNKQERLWSATEKMPEVKARNLYAGLGAAQGAAVRSTPFQWGASGLSDAVQREMLEKAGLKKELGEAMIAYLRGEQANEGDLFRRRKGLIGSIVHSSPVYIGSDIDRSYRFMPSEFNQGQSSGADTYRDYVKAKKAGDHRPGLIFIGSNDGILHGFDAKTGVEVYGFTPRAVLGEMAHSSNKGFMQRFLMDGPLVERDAYWDGKWRNVLLGSTGAGPSAVFALDVSDTRQSAMNADTLLWELDAGKHAELGHVLSAPEVGVLRDGTWVAVFGNGYESKSRKAQLFVVELKTGRVISTLNTGVGSAEKPNGLGGVALVKDGMQVITAAYAGDLHGNVWKFDLASRSSADWRVAFDGRALFTTEKGRPVTAAPATVTHPAGGVMVLVGTGKLFDEGDEKSTEEESLYGLWDRSNLSIGRNGAPVWGKGERIERTKVRALRPQMDSAKNYATTSHLPLDWNRERGWRMPLTMLSEKGQRLIVAPQLVTGMALFETMSPVMSTEDADNACKTRILTPAFSLLLDPLSGSMAKKAVIDTDGNSRIDARDKVVAGWRVEDWTGRSVVLTQEPPQPCGMAPCTQSSPPRNDSCPPGTLVNNVQNASQSYSLCMSVPGPSRWWWRELAAPGASEEEDGGDGSLVDGEDI